MHPFEDLSVPDDSTGIHWFGQSSFALKHPDGTILQTDPYFPPERPPDQFIHARPPLLESTLRTDLILLTHNHGDHTCVESISRIQTAFPEVACVGAVESVEEIVKAGIPLERATPLVSGESARIGPFAVTAVWAKPPDGVPSDEIAPPDVTHLGFVIDLGHVKVYLSGDPINTFGEHDAMIEPIRQLAPDIGLLTTHPSEGEFPFFDGSAKMADQVGLNTAIPAHYDCFVTRTYDPQDWAGHIRNRGVTPLIIPYNQAVVYAP